MREQGGKETLAKYKQRIYITAHNIFNMTKKLLPQSKQVAPKATNKTKITSNKAQPKKMNKNRKQPAPDDESSSDEAPETPHGYSRKKTKKITKEEIETLKMTRLRRFLRTLTQKMKLTKLSFILFLMHFHVFVELIAYSKKSSLYLVLIFPGELSKGTGLITSMWYNYKSYL